MVFIYDEIFSIVISTQGRRFALKICDENERNVIEQHKEIIIIVIACFAHLMTNNIFVTRSFLVVMVPLHINLALTTSAFFRNT